MPVSVAIKPKPRVPSSKKGGVLVSAPKRRGRKPKARIESRRDFLGYVVRKSLEGYAVYAQEDIQEGGVHTVEEQATAITLPQSLQQNFDDADLRQEVMGYATRIRMALYHKDNCKMHLDKESPQNVSISYTIDDADARLWYLDPDMVDVSERAFESGEEHAHFLNAVAHQNFSNKAYKKWREAYKEKALSEMISAELMRMYGTDNEREELERVQSRCAAKQRKEYVASTSDESRHTSAVQKSSPIPAVPVSHSIVTAKEQPRAAAVPRPFAELEEAAPRVSASQPVPVPHTEAVATGGDVVVPLIEEDEDETPLSDGAPTLLYRAPKKESDEGPHLTGDYWHDVIENYHYASRIMDRYRGIRGFFAREFRHSDFLRDRLAYREATRQYHAIRPRFVRKEIKEVLGEAIDNANIHLSIDHFYLKTAFWIANSIKSYGQYRVSEVCGAAWKDRCDVWFGSDDDSRMGNDVRNASLVGVIRMGLLGVPFASSGDTPSADECLALIYESNGDFLREVRDIRLNALVRQRVWSDPQMTPLDDSMIAQLDAPTTGYVMGALAFRALLNGVELSLNPDEKGYSALALRLSESLSSGTDASRAISTPAPLAPTDIPRDTTRDALIEEVFSHPESSQKSTPKVHAVSVVPAPRAVSAKKISHDAALEADVRFDDMARASCAESLSTLRKIYAIKDGQGKHTKEAQRLWERWSTPAALAEAGIVRVEIMEGETLVGAIRRAFRAYPDILKRRPMELFVLQSNMHYDRDPISPATMERALEEGQEDDMIYLDTSGNAWWLRKGE